VTGTLDGKVVLLSGTGRSMGRVTQRVSAEGAIVAGGDIDAAAAAETLELIQKDGFSPGTAGPLDVTDEDSARAWVADCVSNAGAARFALLEDQPFAEIPAPRPVAGPPGENEVERCWFSLHCCSQAHPVGVATAQLSISSVTLSSVIRIAVTRARLRPTQRRWTSAATSVTGSARPTPSTSSGP
jgi:hypothetical protein